MAMTDFRKMYEADSWDDLNYQQYLKSDPSYMERRKYEEEMRYREMMVNQLRDRFIKPIVDPKSVSKPVNPVLLLLEI